MLRLFFFVRAVLSARLGTGKGGVRMAPDELVGAVLQVGAAAGMYVCVVVVLFLARAA